MARHPALGAPGRRDATGNMTRALAAKGEALPLEIPGDIRPNHGAPIPPTVHGSPLMRARELVGPLWPYAVLIGIPGAVFILPDLFGGHLLMTGDNVQQNYPLHVLAGSMFRRGELPFWNQYIFSGTPLLAGFNAGAFYPLVGLFVILPDRVAWIATEVILFSLIAVGMYLFLRALKLSVTACVLAAAVFTFSGVVLSQANHVDMTEGFVSVPFMLLAVLHILRDGRWRWSVLLGIAFALVIFGGAPEAMLDEALLVIAYAAVSAGFDRLRWWRVLTRCGAGAALALALSAVQWLPGIAAIDSSQRSGLGRAFAASGSFPPANGLLSLVPYLFGGYGHLGEQKFFSHYNLPEVEIYLGILPIVALLSLWHPRWPSRLAGRERATWYIVGTIGLLLAFGANTPLEHLFNSIPLYGQQRLQSRNMIDVSVAVTVLFAGWLDRRTDAGKTCGRFDRWVGFVPLGVVLALAIWAVADPRSLITTLTTASGSPGEIHTVREASSIALAFCLTAGVIVWLRAKLRRGLWMAAVTVFMLIDLGLIAGTSQLIVAPSNALLSGHTPVENYLASHLAPGGRYDVYDPLGYSSGLSELDNGLPDDNVLALLPSVGGYASIVSGEYDARTLTHAQGDLNVPLIGSDAFRELDLQDIVTAPEYFLVPLEKAPTGLGKVSPVSEHQGVDPVLPMGSRAVISGSGYADSPAPRGSLASGQTSRWFFGRSLHPTRASVLLTRSATAAQVRFGTVTQKGTTRWSSPVSVDRGTRRVVAPLPAGKAVGLAVQVLKGRLPAHQAVVVAGARDYELDGSLSSAVQPGVWSQATSIGGYTVFDRTRPPAPIHAERSPGQPGARVTVLSNGDNGETVQVRTTEPVVVVRDVAWDGGWHASDSTNGAPPRAVAVNRHNLVQQVRLPVGNDVVTFAYQPRHWLVASLLSEASSLFLVILLLVVLRRRWGRRGPRRHRASGVPTQEPTPEPTSIPVPVPVSVSTPALQD